MTNYNSDGHLDDGEWSWVERLRHRPPIDEGFVACEWLGLRTMTESPIETGFLSAFFWKPDGVSFALRRAEDIGPPERRDMIVVPQAIVLGCRVDFLITMYFSDPERQLRLVVECDGHDFHDRTKEQAARDRARDRKLTAKGIRVFRFTGSEIWANPYGCVREIVDVWLNEQYAHRYREVA